MTGYHDNYFEYKSVHDYTGFKSAESELSEMMLPRNTWPSISISYLMKIYQTLNIRLNCTSATEWVKENLIKYMTRELRKSNPWQIPCGITTPTSPTRCGKWCIKWPSPVEEEEDPIQHTYKCSERVHTVQFYSTKLSSTSELHTKTYTFKTVSLILSADYYDCYY